MKIKEKIELEKKAKDFILEFLNSHKEKAYSSIELNEEFRKEGGVTPYPIRCAIWYLLDEMKIQFDKENKLKLYEKRTIA